MRFLVCLCFVLMVYTGSSVVFSKKYLNDKVNENIMQQRYQSSVERGRAGLDALYEEGFSLRKKEELSSFFSTGDERRLPKGFVISPMAPQAASASGGMTVSSSGLSYKIESYTEFDLTFIIGIVLSFLALVLTFDSVSGDREEGTLRQILSNTVSRPVVLVGKFVAVLLVLLITILLGSILSTIIFQIQIGQDIIFLFPWETLLTIPVSLVYLSIFISLGLWISASVARSSTSLSLLLLMWITVVVLAPNIGGMLVQRFSPVTSQEEHNARFQAIIGAAPMPLETAEFYQGKGTEDQWRVVDQFETRQNESFEQLITQRFNELTGQAEEAEFLNCISPYGAFKQVMERIASTGLGYHAEFFQASREYRTELLQFIRDRDRHDPESKHHIIIIPRLRAMSNKPVDPAIVPVFVPPSRHVSGQTIVIAVPWFGYLCFLSVLFFSLAFVSFVKMDVR